MGLSYSRANPKVTQVAPIQTTDLGMFGKVKADYGLNDTTAVTGSSYFLWKEKKMEESSTLRKSLPPLRETRHTDHSTGIAPNVMQVPGAISLDIQLVNDETSIIRSHPPRRLQRLEPKLLISESLMSKKATVAAREAQRNHSQTQAELSRSFNRELRANEQNIRVESKQSRENMQNNNCSEEEYLVCLEHDQSFNIDCEDSWDNLNSEQHYARDYNSNYMHCTMEKPVKHHGKSNVFCDGSSNESLDRWAEEGRRSHTKSVSARAKTEKIPMFDEFFDQDL
ncbi:factor associated with metabolism and energy isoform X1 [Latimeria chalumnae]|uniref:factor associated with metabolism and energy isoform X1 n=1 Tax=Latimeria chalumnae TaxID=7897 RepID=UPI0003C18CC1